MKVLFVSLGCDKNLVDSEEMLGSLVNAGYELTDDEEEAQVAIVNTCCFIGDAKKESIETILELGQRRTKGDLSALIVTGCLAQRYSREILKEIPEVDAVIGTTAWEELPEVLQSVLKGNTSISREGTERGAAAADAGRSHEGAAVGEKSPETCSVRTRRTKEHENNASEENNLRIRLGDLTRLPPENPWRKLTTLNGSGYLRIAEGCSKCCTYCIIPSIRGPYRSIPMEQVIKTAEGLAEQGVRELILVAQETTIYGEDLYGEKRLPDLLRALARIEGICWIRLLYCYPEEITSALVEVIRDEPKVLHYIDMPVQHASDDVLRRMGRRTNRKELEEKIALLRREIPDICIRTTLITGFPGELEKDHKTLLSFVRRMKFDRLGVFAYSREEGTPAAKMKNQIPAPVKKKRLKELMLLQQEIAFKKARKMKGKTVEAIIEGRISGEDVYTARTYMDAPGVDGAVFVETGRDLMTGEFLSVKVTGSDGYDLIGVPAI